MKYPYILLFRYKKYSSQIDNFLLENESKFNCSFFITHKKSDLNNFFDVNYNLLVTIGEKENDHAKGAPDDPINEYSQDIFSILPKRINDRWLHFPITNFKEEFIIDFFNRRVNYCYLNYVTDKKAMCPDFSLFTTCYNSYDKIIRAYNSIKSQTLLDWEWVVLDDSPNDEHFVFLKKTLSNDKRIRLYKRSENNGNIGNVKNEAVSLCRGKYQLEMDHDDEILPSVLSDSVKIFEHDPDVGFIYMNFINIYEDGRNFKYGDFLALGYSGYYMEKYNGKWVYVCVSPNINNVTLSHIVSVPNHPRIWRKSTLMSIGNYCESLPILDDYELLVRTALNTKMVKLNTLGYVQYMNDNNNNFSLIRNSEINRIIWDLKRVCYENYKLDDNMKTVNAYEDPDYIYNHSQIWKRSGFEDKFCNKNINLEYKKQICILGVKTFLDNMPKIRELYNDKDHAIDFILLDNQLNNETLCNLLDTHNFSRMKCYSMNDCSYDELEKYFHLIYRSSHDYYIYV
jgi:glycosyltransferase involved in cell wall biosynthesis